MPGPKILHYLVDHHYSEPTRIYSVTEDSKGDLSMELRARFQAESIEHVAYALNSLDIPRPLVLVDPHPLIVEHLRAKGFRVR